eukprot:5807939-Alexandrium_andersonii.AAC.1
MAQTHVSSPAYHLKYSRAWQPSATATADQEGGPPPTSFDEWAASLTRPGKYVDALSLQAIARRCQRTIALVDRAFTAREVVHVFGARTRPD